MSFNITIKSLVLIFGILSVFQSQAQVFGSKVTPANYQYSMNITGAYFVDCEFGGELEDSVAAFVGTELRGVAAVTEMNNGKFISFLTIFSNSAIGENITFKYYDKSTGSTTELDAVVDFKEGNILGGRSTPFRFYKGDEIIDPVIALQNDSLYIEDVDATFKTFQWFNSSVIDGAIDTYFKAIDFGDYYVEVITQQGCKVVSNTVKYSPVGFGDDIDKLNFSVYPNPCTTTTTINTSLLNGKDFTIKLVDNEGLELKIISIPLTENTIQLNMENIPSGNYNIILQNASTLVSESIVKIQ